ncbi:acetylxylan esterase [Micromonospora sp. BRA006-A]|nr:acetylxylan esterase [Micromonospora sp. BRA006-A]
MGSSQGGGLALAAAGLVDGLAALLVTAPFLCDIQRAIELTEASPYGEIASYLAVHREAEEPVRHTLSYVDGVTFARRATAPARSGSACGTRSAHPAPASPPATGTPQPGRPRRYGRCTRTRSTATRREAVHVRRQLRWLDTVIRTAGTAAG